MVRTFQTQFYSYAYEQLQAVMLFIKHNSSTLYWQQEVKVAFIPHKAGAHSVPIKSPVMTLDTLRQRRQHRLMFTTFLWLCGCRWILLVKTESPTMTYFPIKDHLVSLSVFDLVVEVLWQLQTFINLSLKPDGALSKKRQHEVLWLS